MYSVQLAYMFMLFLSPKENGVLDFADFLAFMATAYREEQSSNDLYEAFSVSQQHGVLFYSELR